MFYLLRLLSLRYWLGHRGGFFLAALGVSLGLAVFVAIQIANHSVLAAFNTSLDAVTGKANLQIRGGARGLPEEIYTKLITNPDRRIRALAPVSAKTLYSPTLSTSVLVMGIDPFAEADFRDWDDDAKSNEKPNSASACRSASFIGFLTDAHAVAISQSLAKRYKLHEGSAIEIYSGARRVRFAVRSVLAGANAGQAFGGDFLLLDIAAAQEAFGTQGSLTEIDLMVAEDKVPEVSAMLRRLCPPDAVIQRPAQRGAEVAGLLGAFQLNLSMLSSISLFVGAFLIYNAIAIAVVRRRSEVAVLRAFGTDQGSLMRLFLIEAAFIGLIGSAFGMLLGIALARFALHAVSTTVSALYLSVKARELVAPPWLWWGGPLGGTGLAVLSAIPAAREAATTPPRVAMLRATLHHATTKMAWLLLGAGGVSLCLAWGLCQPAITHLSIFAGFAASFFTLAGFALFTPIVTYYGGHLSQISLGRWFGIESTLAGAYLQRALYRSSLVIAALMVSLSMSIGLTVMVRSFRDTVADWVSSSIKADLYIAPANGFSGDLGPGLPPEVVKYATTMPQVRIYETLRGASTEVDGKRVFIAANTLPTLLTGDRRTRFKDAVGGLDAAKRSFLAGHAVLVSERFANLLGYGAGSSVKITTPQGPVAFPIAGVFYDYQPDECTMYMPLAVFRHYWHDNALDGIALYLKPGVATASVKADIERRFGARYQLSLMANDQIRDSVFKTFDQTFAVTYALQLIAVIVAAIGIFDTLIAMLLERSREIATLRALGASPGQIMKLTLIEFGLIGFFAWAIGMAAGLCLAWELITVINKQFFGWTILWTLPTSALGQALALGLAAALGSGIIPAALAARRAIAPALQTE